jgi:hypothetical protein
MHPTEPRKSSKVWIIIGIVFVALMLAGGVGLYFGGKFLGQLIAQSRAKAEQRATKLNEVETQGREMQQALRNSVDRQTVGVGMADRLAKFSKSAGEAAESSSGMEKKYLLVSQRILSSMAPALAKYEAASKELREAGYAKPVSLKSQDAIAARVQLVKNFGEANDGLKQLLEGMENRVGQELDKEGVTGIDRDKAVKDFRSANVDLTLKIRACDTELVDTLLKMLAILNTNWGLWSSDGVKVRFNDTATAQEYNKLLASIRDIGARQVTAQKELVQRTNQRAGTAAVVK